MLGRAEVVDILMNQGVQEPVAWDIVVTMPPEYFDEMDEVAVSDDITNVIWGYVEQQDRYCDRVPI
jgi:hypothetical protein